MSRFGAAWAQLHAALEALLLERATLLRELPASSSGQTVPELLVESGPICHREGCRAATLEPFGLEETIGPAVRAWRCPSCERLTWTDEAD